MAQPATDKPLLNAGRNRILNTIPANNERIAYKQLLKTLKQKEMHHVRTQLVVWCDHFIESRRIANMEDILQAQEAAELHKHVQNLKPICSEIGLVPTIRALIQRPV